MTELRPRSTASQLAEFFEQWAAQPRYALALHTLSEDELVAATATAGGLGSLAVSVGGKLIQQGRAGSGGAAAGAAAGERQQRLQGIAVCWDLQQAFFLELSGGLGGCLGCLAQCSAWMHGMSYFSSRHAPPSLTGHSVLPHLSPQALTARGSCSRAAVPRCWMACVLCWPRPLPRSATTLQRPCQSCCS